MFKMTIVYAGKVVAYPDRSVPSSAGGRFNMAPKCLECLLTEGGQCACPTWGKMIGVCI